MENFQKTKYEYLLNNFNKAADHLISSCSKLTIEIVEQGVKYVQS